MIDQSSNTMLDTLEWNNTFNFPSIFTILACNKFPLDSEDFSCCCEDMQSEY